MATHVTLHIGLPKTGTTALQQALAGHTATLKSAGWVYPVTAGRTDHCEEVADLRLQLLTTSAPHHSGYIRLLRSARPGAWANLVVRVRATQTRAVISNEAMSSLPAPVATRIIDQLTGNRPRTATVVLVVRPLSALLASAYGQMAQDTVVPSFELWTKAWLLTKLQQLESPRMDDWTDGFLVARNWSAGGAEVVCVQYSSEVEKFSASALNALGLAELSNAISLPRSNPSMSALGLAAWQRFLRTGVDPFDPAIKRLRKVVLNEVPEVGQESSEEHPALAPDMAELVDAAFPQPPPGVVQALGTRPARPGDGESAIASLARRLRQGRPLTIDTLTERGSDVTALAERIAEYKATG